MIAPAAPPGSTIGVVTPGSPPESRAEVQRGIAWWESQGYRAKLMPGALEQDGWHGGSAETRAADLQAAFADPEISAIQTMRGGYGSAQVIPLLDFEAISKTPKAFFGLSDITALHAALLMRAGLVTFYGPSLTMLGQPSPSQFTTDRFLRVLAGETTGPVPEDRDRLTVVSIAGGKASGRIVGGCLLDLVYTFRTPWEIDLDGAIFFFEDSGSAPIQIDRALLYLEQSGKPTTSAAWSSASSREANGTSTRRRPGQRLSRTCSMTASATSASPSSTGSRSGTARAWRRSLSASRRRSTPMRLRSRSTSRRSPFPSRASFRGRTGSSLMEGHVPAWFS